MGPAFGLEVSQVKALQKDEGNEQGQGKVEDGGGLVSKTVIEGPVGGQGMKQIILHLPPGMTDLPKKAGRESGGRQGGHPLPVMSFLLLNPALSSATPAGDNLFRPQDAQGNLDPLGRGEPFGIPSLNLLVPFFPDLRGG